MIGAVLVQIKMAMKAVVKTMANTFTVKYLGPKIGHSWVKDGPRLPGNVSTTHFAYQEVNNKKPAV